MKTLNLNMRPLIGFLSIALALSFSPIMANAGSSERGHKKHHNSSSHSNKHRNRSHVRNYISHNKHRKHSSRHRHNKHNSHRHNSYFQAYTPYRYRRGHYHNNQYCTLVHTFNDPYVVSEYYDDAYYDDRSPVRFSVGVHTNNLDLIFND